MSRAAAHTPMKTNLLTCDAENGRVRCGFREAVARAYSNRIEALANVNNPVMRVASKRKRNGQVIAPEDVLPKQKARNSNSRTIRNNNTGGATTAMLHARFAKVDSRMGSVRQIRTTLGSMCIAKGVVNIA